MSGLPERPLVIDRADSNAASAKREPGKMRRAPAVACRERSPYGHPLIPALRGGSESMLHFGMLCPDLFGHLNPMMALAREMERTGHRVTFYQRLICQSKLESAGFRVRAFAEREFPID